MTLITPESKEAAVHDRWVHDLSDTTLRAALADLSARRAFDRRNPEHRWIMSRRAALSRQALKRKLI